MSKFCLITLAFILGVVAVLLLTPPPMTWLLLGALAATYLTIVGLGIAFIRLAFFGPAICRGRPGKRRVSLTFDDGPDPEGTPPVLDILQSSGIKAAFFFIGERAQKYPNLVRQTVSEGHLVGNHTQRHAWWTNLLGGHRLEAEILAAQSTLEEIIGTRIRYFRSPMGFTNPHLSGILKRLGLTLVGWDVRGLDQKAPGPEPVLRRLLARVRDGSIILLHDAGGNPKTLTALLPTLITTLNDRGFTFVRLDALLEDNLKANEPL